MEQSSALNFLLLQGKEDNRARKAKKDNSDKKFKPRLNLAWQKRLDISKQDRERKDDASSVTGAGVSNSVVAEKLTKK